MRDFYDINNQFHLKREGTSGYSNLMNENLRKLGAGFLQNLASLPSMVNDYDLSYSCLNDTEKIIFVIVYPENCSIQIALVKTFNRFPYCTESRKVLSYCTGLRNVLSYCTGLRRGVPNRTTFARWSP